MAGRGGGSYVLELFGISALAFYTIQLPLNIKFYCICSFLCLLIVFQTSIIYNISFTSRTGTNPLNFFMCPKYNTSILMSKRIIGSQTF